MYIEDKGMYINLTSLHLDKVLQIKKVDRRIKLKKKKKDKYLAQFFKLYIYI